MNPACLLRAEMWETKPACDEPFNNNWLVLLSGGPTLPSLLTRDRLGGSSWNKGGAETGESRQGVSAMHRLLR